MQNLLNAINEAARPYGMEMNIVITKTVIVSVYGFSYKMLISIQFIQLSVTLSQNLKSTYNSKCYTSTTNKKMVYLWSVNN